MKEKIDSSMSLLAAIVMTLFLSFLLVFIGLITLSEARTERENTKELLEEMNAKLDSIKVLSETILYD